ncbi:MAG: 23S rRNA (pseudouridine(1915)-N(3))-methyltransferase RlmH [Bacteriovoracaceae bacterium]|nr:23S rRNA (pseudouridine(1915)-N(3))-methyltransferase RlmH [Bacteriovoracaceae bacterium]
MKSFKLITVGSLGKAYLDLQKDFLKRLRPPCQLVEVAHHRDLAKEGKNVLAAVEPGDTPILLDARGPLMSSEEFATWFYQRWDQGQKLCFILGGTLGHSTQVYQQVKTSIALSKMTFPHELCRIIFLEQLYRIQCIKSGHPYHQMP